MKKIILSIVMVLVIIVLISLNNKETTAPVIEEVVKNEEILKNEEVIKENMNSTAIIKTNMGDITIELYAEKTPKTVENFVKLASGGFYEGVKFHRIIEGFMNQTGDPLTKDDSLIGQWGTGGPGYQFEDEFVEDLSNTIGTLSMANSGPGTNGSQFFINTGDNVFLDGKHTVFGQVTEGMDVVIEISSVETTGSPFDRPKSPVVIEEITIK
jgi:cyclophilin family peptidyl-prolyl cis-trans isomerase